MLKTDYLMDLVPEVLKDMDNDCGETGVFYSENAVCLLLGTIAIENYLQRYSKDVQNNGLSILPIDKAAFYDIQKRYGEKCPYIARYEFEMLSENNILAIMVARLKYFNSPEPIPNKDDIKALAGYWAKYYNPQYGNGNEEEFINKYELFVTKNFLRNRKK